jgi:glycosyltransferase EpsF
MVMGKMLGGGVESVIMNYYRHIDRSQVQFDFLVDEDSTLVPRDEIEALGGRVFEIPPYQHVLQYQRVLIQLFKREKWPIVHSNINALSVFPLRAAKRAGVPVRIAHSHSTSGKGEYAKNAVKGFLRLFANVYPTHRFACSQYAGQWLFGKKAPFDIVYNAIDIDRFVFNETVRTRVRSELGLRDDQFVVGHVGRFMAQKNHEFLIKVFAQLVDRRPGAILLLVGEGELKSAIEKKVDEYGLTSNVRFLGQRNDVNELYQAFDAFVLPSLYEGLCVVGVEAQCAGLPCLLSDQITTEVNMSGEVEFLTIDDSTPWINHLSRVDNDGNRFVNASLFEDYGINHAAIKLTRIYNNLLAKAGI